MESPYRDLSVAMQNFGPQNVPQGHLIRRSKWDFGVVIDPEVRFRVRFRLIFGFRTDSEVRFRLGLDLLPIPIVRFRMKQPEVRFRFRIAKSDPESDRNRTLNRVKSDLIICYF